MKGVQPNRVTIAHLPPAAVPMVQDALSQFLQIQVADLTSLSFTETPSEKTEGCINLTATMDGHDAIWVQPLISLGSWFMKQLTVLDEAFSSGGNDPAVIKHVLDTIELRFVGREIATGELHWDLEARYDRTMREIEMIRPQAPKPNEIFVVTKIIFHGIGAKHRQVVSDAVTEYAGQRPTTVARDEGENVVYCHPGSKPFRSGNPELLAKELMANIAAALPAEQGAEPRRVIVQGYDEPYRATQKGDHFAFEAVEGDLYKPTWMRIYAPAQGFEHTMTEMADYVCGELADRFGLKSAAVLWKEKEVGTYMALNTHVADIRIDASVPFADIEALTNDALAYLLQLCPVDPAENAGDKHLLRGVVIGGYDERAAKESWTHDPNCYAYSWSTSEGDDA